MCSHLYSARCPCSCSCSCCFGTFSAALICTLHEMQVVSCILYLTVCLFVCCCCACEYKYVCVCVCAGLFSFNNHFPINTKRVFFTLINTKLFINICNKNQSAAFAINQHQKAAAETIAHRLLIDPKFSPWQPPC